MIQIALILNIIIIFLEVYTLCKLKNKIDILKYYTYLQNLIALITSILLSIYILLNIPIPEYIKGLRYIATTGLISTMFIYIIFLSKNNKLTKKDFIKGFNPNIGNIILHYISPILSLISFIIFEKEIILNNSIWTGLVAIPSCLYWIIYLILSELKLWKEPYKFSKNNNKLIEIITMISLPISFILISIILWNIK